MQTVLLSKGTTNWNKRTADILKQAFLHVNYTSLVVDKNFRSQGIGTQLCIALENILKEKGCLTF